MASPSKDVDTMLCILVAYQKLGFPSFPSSFFDLELNIRTQLLKKT